nr:heat shock 70 kDa protein 12A-like [Crassostrea gigas]
MRNAAVEGGISSRQLDIALEPEAAFIYFRHVKAPESTNPMGVFKPGSKYLFLDAGGGTVDITVLEVKNNGDIKELHRSSDGELGGSSVDTAFKRALAEITTKEMIENYSRKYLDDYLNMFEDFEIKKRICRKGQICSLKIPMSFNEECLETLGADIKTLVNNSKYKDTFILRGDRMRIKSFETFFQPACDEIIKLLKKMFQSPKLIDVKKILMIGGVSESCIFQEAIRDAFPNYQVVVPEEAGLAVLRGAVLLGFYSGTKPCRVSRHTYGVDKDARFDPAVHEESKKEVIDGVEYCTGLFDKLVGKGEKLFDGEHSAIKYYIPITPQQTFVSFSIFYSDKSDPLYTDQCTSLGMVKIHVPVGLKNRTLCVMMSFYKTELTVEAVVLETGESVAGIINFLETES